MNVHQLSNTPPWDWPEEAGMVLREALRDSGVATEDRLLAADLAGSVVVMDGGLARALLEVVRDGDEPDEVRATAAISLGPALEASMTGRDDLEPVEAPVSEAVERSIQTPLRDVYMDPGTPKLVRRRALEVSIRGYEDWHEGAVRAAYHDGDPEWRITALFCAGFLPAFEPLIAEALESDDERVRLEALRAAGKTGVSRAWPHVREILRSPTSDREWLLTAIAAAATLRPEEAPSVLEPFLDSDDDEIVDATNDALSWAGYVVEEEDGADDIDEPPPPSPFGNGDGGQTSGW